MTTVKPSDTPQPEPGRRAPAIRIGPAGWSYDDWKGVVYGPEIPKRLHPLRFLARFFDVVEINSTFYRPATPDYAHRWVEHVEENAHFRFTAKLWERFTHERGQRPQQADVDAFRQGLEPLRAAGKLGALLIQFPWSFKRNAANRRWLGWVAEAFADYPLAVEFRHDSWERGEVYEGLRERGIALCGIDQPIFDRSIAPSARATAPFGYIRLHGRNHEAWFNDNATRDERYDYLYSAEELEPWVERIRALGEEIPEVYAITNNHYRGQAVVNALEMQHALGKPVDGIPQQLLAEYPRLETLLDS